MTYDQQVNYLLSTYPKVLTAEEQQRLRPQLLQIIFLLSQTATPQDTEACYNDFTVH